MKLIIPIPCFNEEKTLEQTICDLPREIEDIDEIEFLVVDDGSTDGTVEVAKKAGVHHILRFGTNRGLATVFAREIDYSLSVGADIVVNTDGDNQYCGDDIARLVRPILEDRADLVVGCRPIIEHPEFNVSKKVLQLFGSWTIRRISRTTVRDAASGFRAFSREACQRLFIHSRFSYCMETLIQAGNSGLRVCSVDVRVNRATRPSRLFKSVPRYVCQQGLIMVSMFLLYRPGAFFFMMSLPFLVLSAFLGFRFLYLVYLVSEPSSERTYIPSLILLVVCTLLGFLLVALGILGELIKSHRRVAEENLYLRRVELSRRS